MRTSIAVTMINCQYYLHHLCIKMPFQNNESARQSTGTLLAKGGVKVIFVSTFLAVYKSLFISLFKSLFISFQYPFNTLSYHRKGTFLVVLLKVLAGYFQLI